MADQIVNGIRLNFSLIIIGIYTVLHLTGGIFAGIAGGKAPYILTKQDQFRVNTEISTISTSSLTSKQGKRHTKWWEKKSGLIFITLASALVIYSYLNPELGSGVASDILVMLLRSVAVMIIWFSFISPVLVKVIKRIFSGTQIKYAVEINNIINMFPRLKNIIDYCWKHSGEYKGMKKVKSFFSTVIILWLTADFRDKNSAD